MSGGAGYVMNEKALSKFALFVEKHKDKDFVQYEPSKMERPEGCKTTTNEGIEDLELGGQNIFIKKIQKQKFINKSISLLCRTMFPFSRNR